MGRVEGRVALITGAARGQGRSHAIRLAEEGASVVGVDACAELPGLPYPFPTPEDLDETRLLVERTGQRFIAIQADVRDLSAMEAAAERAATDLGSLDIVLCNAGVAAFTPVTEITPEQWALTVGINLTGVWHTIRAALPHMIRQNHGGAIVITSSTGGSRGVPHAAHYVAAKHGVVGLMRDVANEVGRYGIRVNTVHPTGVNTAMIQNEATYRLFRPDLDNPRADDVAPVFLKGNLLPVPWVEPRDISNAVLWLVSEEARYVTGETLHVDAGFTQKVH